MLRLLALQEAITEESVEMILWLRLAMGMLTLFVTILIVVGHHFEVRSCSELTRNALGLLSRFLRLLQGPRSQIAVSSTTARRRRRLRLATEFTLVGVQLAATHDSRRTYSRDRILHHEHRHGRRRPSIRHESCARSAYYPRSDVSPFSRHLCRV